MVERSSSFEVERTWPGVLLLEVTYSLQHEMGQESLIHKHRYVLVDINQAIDKSCYEEKPICRVKRAPNQKLILNHKLKTSIHQRACECCRVNLKSPWEVDYNNMNQWIVKEDLTCVLRLEVTLLLRCNTKCARSLPSSIELPFFSGPEEGKLHSIHWGCIRY
ncbi:hypothetical protein F2Q68_00033646 [Brassica cretica]|uniref:Uncharacterized protein n=2 Tax=Brassica cretica TaxID=69181 RepID=A0A8S9GXX6_BRACR|nr:hypothetical protein F2Q68_00033646 [Brassica cretica]KAF3595220.1 hypothetical protein DY000_02020683 [Brassica cretica]